MPVAQTQQDVAEKERCDSGNQELFCNNETPLSVLFCFFRLYQPSHNSCHNPAHKWPSLLCHCFLWVWNPGQVTPPLQLHSSAVFLWRSEATVVTRINIKANLIFYCSTCGTTYNSHPKTNAWFNYINSLVCSYWENQFCIFSLHKGNIWNIIQLCGKSETA